MPATHSHATPGASRLCVRHAVGGCPPAGPACAAMPLLAAAVLAGRRMPSTSLEDEASKVNGCYFSVHSCWCSMQQNPARKGRPSSNYKSPVHAAQPTSNKHSQGPPEKRRVRYQWASSCTAPDAANTAARPSKRRQSAGESTCAPPAAEARAACPAGARPQMGS